MQYIIAVVTREHLLPQCCPFPPCTSFAFSPSPSSQSVATELLSMPEHYGDGFGDMPTSVYQFNNCEFQYFDWEDDSTSVLFLWLRNPL